MNRKERRAAARNEAKAPFIPRRMRQRVADIQKNGITAQDLTHEFERGKRVAEVDAARFILTMAYAAFCRTLKAKHKFGHKRICDTLQEVDRIFAQEIDSIEAAEKCLQETGVSFDFYDPFDRVQESEKA